jgi:acetoin utilization deacetylase AcuC-like enzyme
VDEINLALQCSATIMEARPKTGFVYHEKYLDHDTGPNHPETKQRLTAIVEHLRKNRLLDELILIEPQQAETHWVAKVHSPRYIEMVREMCQTGIKVIDAGDTRVCAESYAAALLAAGGVLAAVDKVMEGRVRNAFCAVRPPGHHAEHDNAMGFCVFNNVAIGACYVQGRYKLERIAVIDWDVHHGNGTQHRFYSDPTVLYISLHQYPHYPGTGSSLEVGDGNGRGYTMNFPMRPGSGNLEYLLAFEHEIIPALQRFNPEFILISAGFDAHASDPLADIHLTEDAYTNMTRRLMSVADECCDGRIVSVLEGGYNLHALAHSVEAHIRELMQ